MSIQHEIVSFNPVMGSIIVKYFSTEIPEKLEFSIDLPIENGVFPDEQTVNQLIETYKPTVQLQRMAALKTVQIPQYLLDKVVPEVVQVVVEEPVEQNTL
jgi:hypothetical protein